MPLDRPACTVERWEIDRPERRTARRRRGTDPRLLEGTPSSSRCDDVVDHRSARHPHHRRTLARVRIVNDALGPILAIPDLTRSRLELDEGDSIPVVVIQTRIPGVTLTDRDTPIPREHRIALSEDPDLLEESSAVADAMTLTGAQALTAGRVRENVTAAEEMHALSILGREYAHVMTRSVASGGRMAPPERISSDTVVREGLGGDVGQRYPWRADEDTVRALRAAVKACGHENGFLSLSISPGVGIGTNAPPCFGGRLEPEEYEPGMVSTIEPPLLAPSVHSGSGVRLEKMVAIAAGSATLCCEIRSHAPR